MRRHPASTTPTATRYAASAACSTTWPPSPATRSATTAPAPTCPCSPTPPPTNAAPSTCSTPRYRSPPPRSQNNHPTKPANPQVIRGIPYLSCRNFGLTAGLDKPTSGEIRIGGTVVNGLAPGQRDIAMVFQNNALYPHMSVYR